MTNEQRLAIEEEIIEVLKTVFDPEMPVDVWNLGMIYKIDVGDDKHVDIDMTLTAPNCPAADYIVGDVKTKVESLNSIDSATVNLVFEPIWNYNMMSEEARVELGFD